MKDFNIKFRLVGYYWNINQKIKEEKKYKEDADILYNLLTKSFSSTTINEISDSGFSQAFQSNAVFIFQDENRNYYAFSPSEKIARISNVYYNPKEITNVPNKLKNWFYPGYAFKEKAISKYPFIIKKRLYRLSGKSYYYSPDSISVKIIGDDTTIYLNNYKFALSAYFQNDDIDYIKDLISLRWTYFVEEELNCDDCTDKWDYSNCDMDICKEDCETCGGRVLKCKRCFVSRHRTSISIEEDYDLLNKEINSATNILENEYTISNYDYIDNIFIEAKRWITVKDISNINNEEITETDKKILSFVNKYTQTISKEFDTGINIINKYDEYNIIPNEEKEFIDNLFKRGFNLYTKDCTDSIFIESYILIYNGVNREDIENCLKIISNIPEANIQEDKLEPITQIYQNCIKIIPEYRIGIIHQFLEEYNKIETYKQLYSIGCGINMLNKITEPHSTFYNGLLSTDIIWLEKLYDISKNIKYEDERISCYIKKYKLMERLVAKRKSSKNKVSISITKNYNTKSYSLEYSDFKIIDDNFLWGNDIKLEIKGYDGVSDEFIKVEYKFNLESGKKELIKKVNLEQLRKIILKEDGKKWKVEFC
ncbi:hypothetical protein GAY76_16070 [Phocaeicola vulgatus]|uniref:Uncharacterized protein n=1 Tax=Phocaeicola vulgatus TaxID=821 RepID=A0A7J5RRD7_PHOVU|nr:hypothetical protein GAY76_16070 [Phocaeicola vulgatus]